MERGTHIASGGQSAGRMERAGAAGQRHGPHLLDQHPQPYREPGEHRGAVRHHELGETAMRIVIDTETRDGVSVVNTAPAINTSAAASISGGSAAGSPDGATAAAPSSSGILT